MNILLNGEKADARGAENVGELVHRYNLRPEAVLIEHNGVALHRREWLEQKLRDGDRIEIVWAVAGG
jgi:thiamine biosynthesis protein ThiS